MTTGVGVGRQAWGAGLEPLFTVKTKHQVWVKEFWVFFFFNLEVSLSHITF